MKPRPATRAFAIGVSLALLLTTGGLAVEPIDEGGIELPRDDEANHDHAQHDGPGGHLAATRSNVDLVGRMRINQDQEGRVADVGVLGNYAYLAAWSAPNCQKGGVYVFDISKPSAPKQINFIRTANDSYSGEGIQAIHLSTPAFTGDLLAFNNETCTDNAGNTSKHAVGGASFVDVTNPKVHKYLAEGVGDRSAGGFGSPNTSADAHEIHSVFVWEDEQGTPEIADDKAYAVIVDNEEQWDVDILDITDPRNPVLIAEHDLNALFPQIIQPDLGSGSSFLHDMVVKEIDGDQIMLASYWDGGYVALNVNDPASPTYIADSDFTNPDPLLFERTGATLPPEGNGHQAEFSMDNDFVVAADEDFGPFAPFISINGGAPKPFNAGTATGPSLGVGDTLAGPTRFVGQACGSVPAPGGTDVIAVMERGTCSFQAKFDNVTAAGYSAGIVFNSNDPAASPNCEGLVGMLATVTIPSFFVARSAGFEILGVAGYDPDACLSGPNPPLPAVGTAGLPISISVSFDGWGYVHLYSYPSMTELDTYAIPEAHDVTMASGFGDLSVHEVAMSHQKNDLAYFSYYSGGFRVARIVDDELVEVGRFIDEGGNNFWGVQVWEHEGKEYVLASDRDYGVYILEYTGPGTPND
ncbi:MAG: PA domain-containing protein [Candidatus Limnocylindria bacterium]